MGELESMAMAYLSEMFRRKVQEYATEMGISFEEAAERAVITIGGKVIKPMTQAEWTFKAEDKDE